MQEHKPVFSTSAPGKVMLCGEYFVLWGASALAFPARHRQFLNVFYQPEKQTHSWITRVGEEIIFSCEIDKSSLEVQNIRGSLDSAKYIESLIKAVLQINPEAFSHSYRFETLLTFRPEWGLGSSSSLIVNMARFADVDPFALHRMISRGSGYDVACALFEKPLLFKNPEKPEISFPEINYNFIECLHFLPLNIKKDSQKAVKDILSKQISPQALAIASKLSESLSQVNDFNLFTNLLNEYVHLVEKQLGLSNPAKELFRGFQGTIKPLGAWGGDLMLVASQEKENYIKDYFGAKGFKTIIKWHDIIELPQKYVKP